MMVPHTISGPHLALGRLKDEDCSECEVSLATEENCFKTTQKVTPITSEFFCLLLLVLLNHRVLLSFLSTLTLGSLPKKA